MQSNIADFSAHKQRLDPSVIYVGDAVEWQDYDGGVYTSVVTKISYKDHCGSYFATDPKACPLWEKQDYILGIGDGASIAGDVVVRKVPKRQSKRKFAPMRGFK